MWQTYLYGLLYYFKGVANERVERLQHFTVAQKIDEHFRDPRLKALLVADSPHWGIVEPHILRLRLDAAAGIFSGELLSARRVAAFVHRQAPAAGAAARF